MMSGRFDFGFERLGRGDRARRERARRVNAVFSSVAARYDLMNDLMSFGLHRLWKRHAVYIAGLKPGARVLDLAGGTADMAVLMRQRLGERSSEGSSNSGHIVVCDINADMLMAGRDKLYDKGLHQGVDFTQADAECLPYADNSFDCVMLAFGLRNVGDKQKALAAVFAVLKYGGVVNILEFSTLTIPLLQRLYDHYSFAVIPRLGQAVAGDRDSYQYLVESIRMHPDQQTLAAMMGQAGFSRVRYFNLAGGILAQHQGYKL